RSWARPLETPEAQPDFQRPQSSLRWSHARSLRQPRCHLLTLPEPRPAASRQKREVSSPSTILLARRACKSRPCFAPGSFPERCVKSPTARRNRCNRYSSPKPATSCRDRKWEPECGPRWLQTAESETAIPLPDWTSQCRRARLCKESEIQSAVHSHQDQ